MSGPQPLEREARMRPYLSLPRGARLPPPRLLFYASDLPELARRDLGLAAALAQEFPGGSVVVATGSPDAARRSLPGCVEVVKVPRLPDEPARPLARERVRRLRHRLLATLFDLYMPDLVLLDMVGPEAELEARLLLERARAFGSATLVGVSHDRPGEPCFPGAEGDACDRCRSRTRASAREALALRESDRSGG